MPTINQKRLRGFAELNIGFARAMLRATSQIGRVGALYLTSEMSLRHQTILIFTIPLGSTFSLHNGGLNTY